MCLPTFPPSLIAVDVLFFPVSCVRREYFPLFPSLGGLGKPRPPRTCRKGNTLCVLTQGLVEVKEPTPCLNPKEHVEQVASWCTSPLPGQASPGTPSPRLCFHSAPGLPRQGPPGTSHRFSGTVRRPTPLFIDGETLWEGASTRTQKGHMILSLELGSSGHNCLVCLRPHDLERGSSVVRAPSLFPFLFV